MTYEDDMNRHDDKNFPAELRALEASLSELSPASSLDERRLLYEAGYAAALADRPVAPTSTRTTLTAVGSALVGVAATLLVIFIQTETAPPRQAQVIQRGAPEEATARTAPSDVSDEVDQPSESRIASSSVPALRALRDRGMSRIVPQQREAEGDPADLAYSTLRLRDRLLSGDDWSAEPKSPPVSFPDSRSIDSSSPEPANILELQNEFFRELSSHQRANS